MLLAIDAGNSFVKLAYHDGQVWLDSQRILLLDFCREPKQYLQRPVLKVMVSNVAGKIVQKALETVFPQQSIYFINAAAFTYGVRNQYAEPEQLGADRWCALIAVRELIQEDCVIVSLGTALTVDMLTSDGRFLGGVIAPGMQLMRMALAQATDAVAPAVGRVSTFPSNTADAVQTGLTYAALGVIEKTIADFEKQCQGPVS